MGYGSIQARHCNSPYSCRTRGRSSPQRESRSCREGCPTGAGTHTHTHTHTRSRWDTATADSWPSNDQPLCPSVCLSASLWPTPARNQWVRGPTDAMETGQPHSRTLGRAEKGRAESGGTQRTNSPTGSLAPHCPPESRKLLPAPHPGLSAVP